MYGTSSSQLRATVCSVLIGQIQRALQPLV